MLSDTEIKQLKNQTIKELVLQDPKPVLDGLGLNYKEIGYDSYQFRVRSENTASAFISLKNGVWKYKDFGSGNNGNIANVVMDATGKSFKDSLNYVLSQLGLKNYLDLALNQSAQVNQLSEAQKQKLQQLKYSNQQREKSHSISKVLNTYNISTNQLAVDYLRSRGIIKIPSKFKIITGQYTTKNGEVKKAFGIGILTKNGKGADIHFLKKIGDLKTMSFGEKDISFFKNPNSKKVAIFESKMDYAAAYQQMPLDNVNVIIANSTSNAKKVVDVLKEESLVELTFFNQNDKAGYKFVRDVANISEIDTFKSIKYDVMSEYKKDINDLLLDNEKISIRIQQSTKEQFEIIHDAIETILKVQQSVVITSNDLKMASKVIITKEQKR